MEESSSNFHQLKHRYTKTEEHGKCTLSLLYFLQKNSSLVHNGSPRVSHSSRRNLSSHFSTHGPRFRANRYINPKGILLIYIYIESGWREEDELSRFFPHRGSSRIKRDFPTRGKFITEKGGRGVDPRIDFGRLSIPPFPPPFVRNVCRFTTRKGGGESVGYVQRLPAT